MLKRIFGKSSNEENIAASNPPNPVPPPEVQPENSSTFSFFKKKPKKKGASANSSVNDSDEKKDIPASEQQVLYLQAGRPDLPNPAVVAVPVIPKKRSLFFLLCIRRENRKPRLLVLLLVLELVVDRVARVKTILMKKKQILL